MPTLEEIEDYDEIDNMDMDIAEFDPDLVTPIAPAKPKVQVAKSYDDEIQLPISDSFKNMSLKPPQSEEDLRRKPGMKMYDSMTEDERREFKAMQVVYPCYFDKCRSVKQGRRVPISSAVRNPLAKSILDACKILRIPAVFEPEKTHPQDWGNPGRVRLGLRFEGESTHPVLKSKREALLAIAEYLKTHPTTLESVKDLPGPPELMNGTWQPSEIPKVKGFKMNTIVPLHSYFTMKHPETAGAYFKTKTNDKPIEPKKFKQKIQRIRG
ncbi:hypothetical protein CANINC_003365 [Pichia inconspicua]|uniref:Signal recognition particle SEC65 subunit n=1 Tax=Pichia inconspicua TaxID=52247 RepID=A0A4T0WZW2_9ASCO|nr:hypothetical protein CANINC_003365 [[Candida] inconspicua]